MTRFGERSRAATSVKDWMYTGASVSVENAATDDTTTVAGSRIVTWTADGTINVIGAPIDVEYLVVGGGGSGGVWGGGGAGQVASNFGGSKITLPVGTHTVKVGAGGVAASGAVSSLAGIVAIGGGFGAVDANANRAYDGASGGGAHAEATGPNAILGGRSINSVGFRGGNGDQDSTRNAGGGGGGAGAVGGDGVAGSSTSVGGNGGVGVSNSISGTATFYGGGGGGRASGGTATQGTGGNGGGGNASGTGVADDGVDGTGGGGGAGSTSSNYGDGGDGVVIVRWVL